MDLILRNEDTEYWAEYLDTPAMFKPRLTDIPYVCLIWDTTGAANDDQRLVLARALVASGCGYAVCAGIQCERWHDSIDRAAAEADRFLMTTWHDDEDEDDVAHFFVCSTYHPDQEFTRFLVLILGTHPQREEALVEAVRRHARRATSV